MISTWLVQELKAIEFEMNTPLHLFYASAVSSSDSPDHAWTRGKKSFQKAHDVDMGPLPNFNCSGLSSALNMK